MIPWFNLHFIGNQGNNQGSGASGVYYMAWILLYGMDFISMIEFLDFLEWIVILVFACVLIGCCGTYDWACCGNSEYVKGCCFFHPHHQEWWACFQCIGFKVPVGWELPCASIPVPYPNYWWLCTFCCNWAQLQHDW